MRTRITELFGIKYPIICGGMFGFAEPGLCAAISNAGGLGNITAGMYADGEELRKAIREAKALTDKPFGVNITMLPSRYIGPEQYDQYYQVCCEEKIAVIEATGAPAGKFIDMVHEAGIKIMHKVGAVRHALNIERLGYDAVLAAGFEEGGHPLDDDVATTILTPRIVESVSIPVITTGGMVDGRGLAAALALGAEGIMMATRFMATEECKLHPELKAELVRRQETDTVIICKSLNLQGRALKTDLVEQVRQIERSGGGIEQLGPLITGQRIKTANQAGDVNGAVWHIGQSVGLIKEVTTCKELLDTMVNDAKEIFRKNLERFTY